MQNRWLKNYPQGVPHTIDASQHSSIIDAIEKTFQKHSVLPAFSNQGSTLSYDQVNQLSLHFAAYLQKKLGLKKGDRISIVLPNLLQYPVVLFGALRAGLVVVNTNPQYTSREMEHQFKDAGVKAVVILANFVQKIESILPNYPIEHIIITEVGDLFSLPKKLVTNIMLRPFKKIVSLRSIPGAISLREALIRGKKIDFEPVPIAPEDLAFLQYTGETTGISKGVMLSHRNIIANMMQTEAWISPCLEKKNDILITALPLCHVFSLTVNCLVFMQFGGLNVLITNPRDISGFIRELKRHKFTVMTGVNTLFSSLLNSPEFSKIDFSNLKLSVAGAMTLQKSVAEKWSQLTGSLIIEGYGLTEASPVVSVNPPNSAAKVGSIGLPLPSTEVRLLNDSGKDVVVGQPGEICVRGPQVMKGYWNQPEETHRVLKEGWLHTGDIAVEDSDGFLTIVDRKKELILISGFKVYPSEVESVVATHPAVLEVAALGVPDSKSGEVVKIFVVRKKGHSVQAQELIDFCRRTLTAYKVPKFVEFRQELPKSNVGKILRRALKAPPPPAVEGPVPEI